MIKKKNAKKMVTTVCLWVKNVAFNDSPVLDKGYNPGPIHRKMYHINVCS